METMMVVISLCMCLAPLPHVWAMYNSKSSRDQSAIAVSLVVADITRWGIYGYLIANYTIVWCNLPLAMAYLIYLSTIIYYRIKA